MAKASPKRVIAAGDGSTNGLYYQGEIDGRRFINLEFHGGGSGAYFGRDGYNGIRNGLGNTGNQRVERVESELPVRLDAYEIVPDTGGPGEFREGCTLRRIYKFLTPVEVIVVGGRTRVPPFGLYKGKAGSKAKHILVNESGEEKLLASRGSPVNVGENSKVSYTPAGGGIGDPLKRSLNMVTEDVKDGYVSPEAAKKDYGVVFNCKDIDSLKIDYLESEKLRRKRQE